MQQKQKRERRDEAAATPPPRHRNRAGFSARALIGWGAAATLAAAFGLSSYAQAPGKKTASATAPRPGTVAGLSPEDVQTFSARFEKEVWPLMETNCVSCHADKNASQFLMVKNPRAAFLKMLGEGHFDADNHTSIIERVTTTDKTIVMPPPSMGTMKPAEIAVFTRFAEDVKGRQTAHGGKPDEAFPAHLLTKFSGKKPPAGLDNTFLSFRQLRGKIQTIFADDWKRGDRDLFVENVHLFGGADFIKRFDETTKASATFLTGVDLMGRDIASKAYLARSGPFAGFPESLPSPVGVSAPSAPVRQAINQLYNRMLFRDATSTEMRQAFTFLQGVYRAQSGLAQTAPQDLRFRLTVRDDRGMSTMQDVRVAVTADTKHGLYSEFVDQSQDAADDKIKTATRTLAQAFWFAPGDTGQKVFVTNSGTHGNVSIAGITLRGPLPSEEEKVITVDDPSVQLDGAWRGKKDNGFSSYEDNNENKGDSHITIPVKVEKPGRYEVGITWRRYNNPVGGKGKGRGPRGAPANGASNVRVEVVSQDRESQLAIPSPPPVPPKGEAHFYIDQTVDTIPFWDLQTVFQFGGGETEGVEISNDRTRKRVVADAVRLMPTGAKPDASPLLLRAKDAQGKDKWADFPTQRFRPYNTIGPNLLMDTDDKGKKEGLSLRFKPTTAQAEGFEVGKFYKVGLVFPGQVDNETRVPVVVKAQASSPIVQIVYPEHAHVGAPITIDASSTFNLQRSALKFSWTQIGGPRVTVADPTAKKLTFTAPQITAQQAAWEGLCRALIGHPDFLFTRPRSLASVPDAKQRRRLQLVKIAQDLLSRTPTPAEVAKVDAGTPLSKIVDGYLQSPEFKDYYFHRVRLYLESHGTPQQDEPARLWTFIALNNRPFKEIMTADYTVDTAFKKQPRPAYHGKTGVLTMKGFIEGKPGLPHFNYPAQVTEKFLGYVFEVPDEIVQARTGITASATTDPNSVCYTCHKVLTPLAYQRGYWDDQGNYRRHDDTGMAIDDTDQKLVGSYPYKGNGMEAFAVQAQNKERFIRTILQTHFVWYFGRELRYEADERVLYKRLWDVAGKNNYAIRPIIRAMILSPEYLNGSSVTPTPPPSNQGERREKLAEFHKKRVQ